MVSCTGFDARPGLHAAVAQGRMGTPVIFVVERWAQGRPEPKASCLGADWLPPTMYRLEDSRSDPWEPSLLRRQQLQTAEEEVLLRPPFLTQSSYVGGEAHCQ